ncbi:MAG TPA: DNA-processing protein DprA [Gemmatimonadales bacterium]|nr:DNA-processing protein DprA [Gemmatimonadales bacterium]
MRASACRDCRLRSALLAELGAVLDLRARSRPALVKLLDCGDLELIELIGGRRKEALRRAHTQGALGAGCPRAAAVCIHDGRFPGRLRAPSAPRLLYHAGDVGLLKQSDRLPAVALLGTKRPSAYGFEMAHTLAYTLSCSGVLVVTLLADGIARAAREGAERSIRGAVVVSASGLQAPRAVHATRDRPRSCIAAELPPGCPGRRWGAVAAERTVVGLADVALVVEAASARELFAVELARARGVRMAAVPGRATSPLSRGPLELLRTGATLVRSAEDVLELLGPPETSAARASRAPRLPSRLARLLDRVGCGEETPERLLAGSDAGEVLLGLAELELMGRVRRTPEGRYIAAAAGTNMFLSR